MKKLFFIAAASTILFASCTAEVTETTDNVRGGEETRIDSTTDVEPVVDSTAELDSADVGIDSTDVIPDESVVAEPEVSPSTK